MQISLESANVKIALAVIGFETRQEEIFRCLDGWIFPKPQVDLVIAGDGRFDLYDAPYDYSKNGWLDACVERYSNIVEFIPYKFSGTQQAKRQKYLDIAGYHNCDFLITVDTDEYLDPVYRDFNTFYGNLIRLSRVVNDRMFYIWSWIPDETIWNKQGNKFPDNEWIRSCRIHKDPGTMRYCCNNHYTWCAKDTTDRQIYEWSVAHKNWEQFNPYIYWGYNVIDGVRLRMDRTLRTEEQKLKGIEWAFFNQHVENSKEHYGIMKAMNMKPPIGFNSWDEFEKAPHTFDRNTGQRIELS